MTESLRRFVLVMVAACGDGHPRTTPDDAAVADAPDVVPPTDAAPSGLHVLPLVGAIAPVHDPAIIETETGFYAFATGNLLRAHFSTDLVTWQFTGTVFATRPTWITTTDPNNRDSLWAPDISFFNERYHLYYSASSFGSNNSCIGHASSPTLAPPVWEDHGPIICSVPADNWNAIDPAVSLDADGKPWMAFGSFWGGIKMIPLDAAGARDGTDFFSLATRQNTAVEAAYIVHRDGYYYLFESVDFCCRGVNSTYKIMVGRSEAITGPYVDKAGVPLLAGGGTLILAGDARWRGPGHNAILQTATGTFNVYHSYDATLVGTPTLRIAEMEWAADGWPVSAGP